MDIDRAIEAFLMTAHAGSFSRAASRMGVTAAAVSRQVAQLEGELGARLFQRTTRSLSLTERGERLRGEVEAPWHELRAALERQREGEAEPHGTLRVSVGTAFGMQQVLPRMPTFLERYPGIALDWSFENRRVDLVAEGFDAAIGTGLDPQSRIVARPVCPVDAVVCAAPAWIERCGRPGEPEALPAADAIRLRSATTGRVRELVLERAGEQRVVSGDNRLTFTELDAMRQAALAGLGYTLLGVHHIVDDLESGRLVRLLPDWRAPRLWIQVYYPTRELLEPKVRVFVDYLVEQFGHPAYRDRLARWLGQSVAGFVHDANP
jgi:DNA-binding transcriptional LysR family regulator